MNFMKQYHGHGNISVNLLFRFRVGIFDHDVFSFTDIKYPLEKPTVIFTNPTDARYLIPRKNPAMKAALSTHIRFGN